MVEGAVAPVSHHVTRESPHLPPMPPQQLFQQVLVGRGTRGRHRRSNDAGWMIVYCYMCLVCEVQPKGGVVRTRKGWN